MTSPSMINRLKQHFGFTSFRAGQSDCINALDSHGRALAVFPTGAGKSLCYQLPALGYDGITLVVSPLIALMKDQIDFLRSRGIEAARLDSTLTLDENLALFDSLSAERLKLLYVAPERLKNERFMSTMQRHKISLLAIDEAHCISEWGHNFRPDYLKLPAAAAVLNVERILALTATATPAVVADICREFQIPDAAAVVTGFYRPNLQIQVASVAAADRDALLIRRLETCPAGTTIVYVTLQKTAEKVASALQAAGFQADYYHAGMKPEERTIVQERWKNSDRHIVVATIAFGMGIDKADVRYVYHYNMPKSLENYSQEIGRAGRDGQQSIVELFACPDDIPTLENFVYGDTSTDTALHGLTADLMSLGVQFSVSLYQLARKYDLRDLVLKTALTYMELMGVIREGTPFYNGYKVQFRTPPEQILTKFDVQRGEFLRKVFAAGRKGPRWLTLQPGDISRALQEPRERIERALEYLADTGDLELKMGELQHRFSRLTSEYTPKNIGEELVERFGRREQDEIARIQRLINFVEHPGCHANCLAAYFGEIRQEPCGICTGCIEKGAVQFPMPANTTPARLHDADAGELQTLIHQNNDALSHPRQIARFLCGLSSPLMVKAKLSHHRLFGVLAHVRFHHVLTYAENLEPRGRRNPASVSF